MLQLSFRVRNVEMSCSRLSLPIRRRYIRLIRVGRDTILRSHGISLSNLLPGHDDSAVSTKLRGVYNPSGVARARVRALARAIRTVAFEPHLGSTLCPLAATVSRGTIADHPLRRSVQITRGSGIVWRSTTSSVPGYWSGGMTLKARSTLAWKRESFLRSARHRLKLG